MYKDLTVYQKSRILVNKIYKCSSLFPRSEISGLTSQLRRAAVSVILNIVEGESRNSTKEYLNFLNISYGSINEVKVCLEISLDLKYIDSNTFQELFSLCEEVSKLLYSYKKTLKLKIP